MTRRLSLIVAAALLGAAAGPAVAGDGGGACKGTLVSYSTIKAGTIAVGQTRLYYNSSNATLCAITLHAKATANSRRQTGILIARKNYGGRNYDPIALEAGNYANQAGPVYAKAGNGCSYASGNIVYGTVTYYSPTATSCYGKK